MINIGFEDPTTDTPNQTGENLSAESEETYNVEENWRGYTEEEFEAKIRLYENSSIMISTPFLDTEYHTMKARENIPEDILNKSARLVTNYRDPVKYVNALRDYFDIVDFYAKEYESGIGGMYRSFMDDLANGVIKMHQPIPQYYPRHKSLKFDIDQFVRLLTHREEKPEVVLHLHSKSDPTAIMTNNSAPWMKQFKNFDKDSEVEIEMYESDEEIRDPQRFSIGGRVVPAKKLKASTFNNTTYSGRSYREQAADQLANFERIQEKKVQKNISSKKGSMKSLVETMDSMADYIDHIQSRSVRELVKNDVAENFASNSKFSFGIQSEITNFVSHYMDLSLDTEQKSPTITVKDENEAEDKKAFFKRSAEVSNVIFERVKSFNEKYKNVLDELYKNQLKANVETGIGKGDPW